MSKIIKLQKISKYYGAGSARFAALNEIDLSINSGEFLAIVGPSGCGKSTLLNIIGLLDKIDSGKYFLLDKEITPRTSSNSLASIRRDKIGFIFQNFNLLPRTSALFNVMMPAIYSGLKNRKEKALRLLEIVGLSKRIKHTPSQLSGGEQQRVAIARALINNPQIILADEPSGNLDSASGGEILKILKELNKQGKTIIVVTHDQSIAAQADRVVRMRDGKVIK